METLLAVQLQSNLTAKWNPRPAESNQVDQKVSKRVWYKKEEVFKIGCKEDVYNISYVIKGVHNFASLSELSGVSIYVYTFYVVI